LEDEIADDLADGGVGWDEALRECAVLAAEDGGEEVADEGRVVGALGDLAFLLGTQPPVGEQIEYGVEELLLGGLLGRGIGDGLLLGESGEAFGGAEGRLEELHVRALLADGGIPADFLVAFLADAGGGERRGLLV
jgi:hypothetical protein